MKLTTEDVQNLLGLISSERLTLKGNEAKTLVQLQFKLEAVLQEAALKGGDPVSTPPAELTSA